MGLASQCSSPQRPVRRFALRAEFPRIGRLPQRKRRRGSDERRVAWQAASPLWQLAWRRQPFAWIDHRASFKPGNILAGKGGKLTGMLVLGLRDVNQHTNSME